MKSSDAAIADADSLGKPELGRLNVVRMLAAPPGLSAELKATLEKAILAAMADPEFTKWLQQTGNEAHPAGADATAQSVQDLMAFYKNYLHLLKKK